MVDKFESLNLHAFLNMFKDHFTADVFGLASFDENGFITSYNPSLADILDRDKENLIGMNLLELLQISDLDVDEILGKDDFKAQFKFDQKYLSLFISRLNGVNHPKEAIAMVCDMTSQTHFVIDLDESLSQLRLLIDQFDIGLVLLDEHHQIIEANDTFCHNLGYERQDIIGLSGFDFIHEFKDKVANQSIPMKTPFFFGNDNKHIRKDGTLIPIKGFCTKGKINGKLISMCLYQNITDQMLSSMRLEQSEEMLKNFITNSTDVIMVLDKAMEIKYLSPNLKKVFGYTKYLPRNEIISQYLPLQNADFINFIAKSMKLKDSENEYEYITKSKNGKQKFFSIRTSTIKSEEKLIICYIRDVTKDKKYIEELKILSYTDQLTQLHNRQYMEEQLVELRQIGNFPLSIISADLDGLKEVNDSLGHQAGDELLRRFANILRESHNKYEEIFRIGGDEFIIIATKCNEKAAAKLITKIDQRISKHNSLPSSSLKISASIGYATSEHFAISLSTMLAQADKAMYKIKNAKKAQ